MKRRNLLAGILALCLCGSVGAETAEPLRFQRSECGKYVFASGETAVLLAFAHRYQDALWADWRTNDVAVRRMREIEKRITESQGCGFHVGFDETKSAFVAAIR